MTTMQTRTRGLAQNHWRKIKNAPQGLVLGRSMIDIMRAVAVSFCKALPAGEGRARRLASNFRLPIHEPETSAL
jgi:hypothetical protein